MARKTSGGSVYQRRYRDRKTGEWKICPTYSIKYYVPSQIEPVRETTNFTQWEDAHALLKQRIGKSVTESPSSRRSASVRIKELLQLVLDDYELKDRRSLADVRSKIQRHLLPAFGSLLAKDFTDAHVIRYMNQRKRTGAKPATINRELAPLRRALRLGSEKTPPLVLSLFKWPVLPEDNIREGLLEPERYRAVRDALPGVFLQTAFVVAYHTGVRKGELLSIERSQIDWRLGRINLKAVATKGKKRRYLPIYGDMQAYLERCEAETQQLCPDTPFLFHHDDGTPILSFRKAWRRACYAAGVPDLKFHDLRRTALTHMEEAGIPRSVATAISGHLTESVYKRYVISRSKALKDAGEVLEAYLKTSLGTATGTAE